MRLDGSCHCGAVRFSLEAYAPVPYLRCYCSICRKTAGGGGFAVNLGAHADTLEVEGGEHVSVFHATVGQEQGTAEVEQGTAEVEKGTAERRFCARCGSALWVWNPDWPDLVHPFASAIDTPLPEPPEQVHMLLASKANWVRVDAEKGEAQFDEYPSESLEEWHRSHGLAET